MKSTGSGQTMETITFNKITYMKDSNDNKWFKFPPNDTSTPKDTSPTDSVKFTTTEDKAAASTITYKKLGKEKCGKLTCFKYQTIDSKQPADLVYFWFDTKDHRLQHWYSKDSNGTTDFVISYESVSISAPSPTKDFNAADASQVLQTIPGSNTTDDGSGDVTDGDTGIAE
jgi:hypothetical protein